jgi:hypothetical protein
MARKRISQSLRNKKKNKAEKEKIIEFGGFIDGQSFGIKNGDPDYEFMTGLWNAIDQDVKNTKKK